MFETDLWFQVEDMVSNFMKKRIVISINMMGLQARPQGAGAGGSGGAAGRRCGRAPAPRRQFGSKVGRACVSGGGLRGQPGGCQPPALAPGHTPAMA